MNRQQFEAKGSVRFGVRSGSVRLLAHGLVWSSSRISVRV